MKKVLLFAIVAILAATCAFADNLDKLSAGTQMFISERDGKVKLPKLTQKLPIVEANDTMVLFMDESLKEAKRERLIAEPEMVNGTEMISAFVRVKSGGFSAIEGMGAKMQTKFNDNLAAMLLPIYKIEAIADLDNVTGIEVAEILKPANDLQRSVTQAGDAISNSAAAQALGLTKQYTGKDVILGIIDTGIDFQHIAFKDKNGNNRIVRAYKLSSSNSTSLTTYSSESQINGLTYDTNTEDHGTHTSSTAGGSSVIVNGSTVTVTDDHANATYGGMAPEANLVIAGLSSLYTTSIGTAIQNICNYADEVGKPCVISLSLGSQAGPHDGTGSIASIVNSCAGNNHIIVYAASNDGMRADYFVNAGTSNGGGMYASGTSTSSKPMMANLQRSWTNATGNVQIYSGDIYAYARTANVPTALKLHVVDTSTGNVVYSTSEYTSTNEIDISGSTGLAEYFKATSSSNISVTRSISTNNKYYWTISYPTFQSTSYSKNSSNIYDSKYALCISVYPTSAGSSSVIDMWEDGYNWFGNDLTLSSSASNSYNLVKGNDECSVSNNATYSKVISVGAYVTKNSITDYNGTTYDFSSKYPNIGDHAYFSSWQTAGYGPLGTALPHINAPGARIVAAVNHYSSDYTTGDYKTDRVNNNTTYPYAAMQGTSMATPCVSGIIAQWLQACVEAGKTPTPDYIKEVMENTWDTDQWTNGAGHGAKTFGTHGKINAIKGIQYILGVSSGPLITANPSSVTFDNTYVTQSSSKTFRVKGVNLNGNVTLSLSDAPNGIFTLSDTNISKANAEAGKDITVTFTPQAANTYTGKITISSDGAEDKTVMLTAKGKLIVPELIADPEDLTFSVKVGASSTQSVGVLAANLEGDVTVTLTDENEVFSIDKETITKEDAEDGTEFYVTFTGTIAGTYTGSILLTSPNCNDQVTISLTGTARDMGTAKDAYLDIANYATIDEAGASVSGMTCIYKYKEYEANNCGWLTVSNFGAQQTDANQEWFSIEATKNTSNSWTATDIFLGDDVYFGSNTSYAAGWIEAYQHFYVTNCTQVKQYAYNRSNTSYPLKIYIYECTENADGTLTPGTSAIETLQNTTTSNEVLTSSELNANKIYKISVYNDYSDLFEIGFRTPLPAQYTLAQLVSQADVVKGKEYRIVDNDLIAVAYNSKMKTLYCKDNNAYDASKKSGEAANGQIDFMRKQGWQTNDWDESNWIALKLSKDPGSILGKKLTGVRGTLLDKENPTMVVTTLPTAGDDAQANINTFIATNYDPIMLSRTGNYFFVHAKPMEFANVLWAKWNQEEDKFELASPISNAIGTVDGAFYADLTKYDGTIGELVDGGVYSFTGYAMLNTNNVSSTVKSISTRGEDETGYVLYPVDNWKYQGKIDGGTVTDIFNLYGDSYREVVAVDYVNSLGLTSKKPFQGVNIVVTRYSDGSKTTVKKIFK